MKKRNNADNTNITMAKKISDLIPSEYSSEEKEEITRTIQEFSQLYAEIIGKGTNS